MSPRAVGSAFAGATGPDGPAGTAARYTAGFWERDNLAAGLTAAAMQLLGVSNIATVPMKRSGSLTGLGAKLSANAAGATVTVKAFINGVDSGLSVAITAGNSKNVATAAATTIPYNAGDEVDLRVTTPAGWTATTADIAASLEVTDD